VRYGQELNKLPRDLDLDAKALEGCFAKSFPDLADPKDGRRLDPVRLRQFAEEWLAYMQSVNLEQAELEREYLDVRDQRDNMVPDTPAPAGAAP
jgi:hypothetical protein